MNSTTEQIKSDSIRIAALNQLLELHAKHIKTLNERIEVLQQTIDQLIYNKTNV